MFVRSIAAAALAACAAGATQAATYDYQFTIVPALRAATKPKAKLTSKAANR